MVHDCFFYYTALIVDYMLVGPDAIIGFYVIICEVEIGFWAKMWAEDDIDFIFEVVLFVIFLIGIDLGIGEVDAEIEKVWVLVEEGLDLFWRGARTGRISVIVAGWGGKDVLRVGIGGVFAIEVERCV